MLQHIIALTGHFQERETRLRIASSFWHIATPDPVQGLLSRPFQLHQGPGTSGHPSASLRTTIVHFFFSLSSVGIGHAAACLPSVCSVMGVVIYTAHDNSTATLISAFCPSTFSSLLHNPIRISCHTTLSTMQANRMRWDLDNLDLSAGSQRVQEDKRRYYVCPGVADGVEDECSSAIR